MGTDRKLESLFDDRASHEQRQRALDALDADPQLQREFRALAAAERSLAGADLDLPAPSERDAMLGAVLQGATDTNRVAAGERRPGAMRSRLVLWFGAPVVAAASALVLWLAWPGEPEEGFHARGEIGKSSVSARVFCARGDEVAAGGAVQRPLRCSIGDSLVVALRVAPVRTSKVHLWLKDASGKAMVPTARLPAGLTHTAEGEQVLDVDIDVLPESTPGLGELHIVVCDRCNSTDAFETARSGDADATTRPAHVVVPVELVHPTDPTAEELP